MGKTTFIKHLLGREYPGSQIGPEPTTDRFVGKPAPSPKRALCQWPGYLGHRWESGPVVDDLAR